MNFASAGIPVVLKDVDESAVQRGLAAIRKNYESALAKGPWKTTGLGPEHRDDHGVNLGTLEPLSASWGAEVAGA